MTDRVAKGNKPAEGKSGELIPMTVRFPEETMSVIDSLAQEFDLGKAEIVRLAVDNRLVKYLGLVRCLNTAQAEEIRRALAGICTEMAEVGSELRRIGVNFNQQVKLEHLKQRLEASRTINLRMAVKDEIMELEKGTNVLRKDELDALMMRYEDATRKAGEALCRILR